MKLFVDTAEITEIEQANSWGILDGVTTNPSLLKKAVVARRAAADESRTQAGEALDIESYLERILTTVGSGKPVSLEVIGVTYAAMRTEALRLFERFNPVAGNVVIKIPVNPTLEAGAGEDADGLRAIADLSAQGIRVNVTLVMNPTQALFAAKAGATYVSPFAGRIDDFLRTSVGMSFDKGDYFPAEGLPRSDGRGVLDDDGVVSGVDLVRKIVTIFDNFATETQVLAASLRNPRQVAEVALAGADVATVPFAVLGNMLRHPKTFEGMQRFVADVVDEYRAFFEAPAPDAHAK
jgi:transaldolase